MLKLVYTSSYKTADELKFIDAKIEIKSSELKVKSKKYTAHDGDYKLIVGYRNSLTPDKNSPWDKLGTKLKINDKTNEYFKFTVIMRKKYQVEKLPKEIILSIFTETTLGKRDTSVIMYYNEYKDTRAPFRFH